MTQTTIFENSKTHETILTWSATLYDPNYLNKSIVIDDVKYAVIGWNDIVTEDSLTRHVILLDGEFQGIIG